MIEEGEIRMGMSIGKRRKNGGRVLGRNRREEEDR
jgi:hypothetical protein